MLLGGDEIGRTQGGNNNAYCQDSELSWFDWALDDDQIALQGYVASLIRLRRDEPLLRLRAFPEANPVEGPQVCWFNEHGAEMAWTEWQDPERRLVAMTIRQHDRHHGIVVLMNSSHVDALFAWPSVVDPAHDDVTRLFSSAIAHHESDPIGTTPAGSLQLLRFGRASAGD